MLSFYKKYWKTAFDIGMIIVTIYLIMWLFSSLYKIAAPIFLSLVVFMIIEPLAKFLHRRRIKKSIATGISMLLFILVVLGVMTFAGVIFIKQVNDLASKIPQYTTQLQTEIALQIDFIQQKFNALPPGLAEKINTYGSSIATQATNLAETALYGLLGFLTSFSNFVVKFSIAVILAYFLSVEIETWKKLAHEKTPRTFKHAFFFLKENVIKGIVGYIKAQLKLISITFALVFIGLLVIGVSNSFALSLLSGFFDILPLLGVSTLFIPWIIYLFIVGSTHLAVSLTVLLSIVLITRQIMEPKITGDTLGVSAFTMFSFMIISLSIFGVAGLILSPILIILIKALYEQGYLKRWVRLPEEEYDKAD